MTTVVIPQVKNGSGDVVEALAHVRLVVAGGKAAIGFRGTNLATEYQGVVIPSDGPLELELAPQSAIAMPDGEPTYYEISVRARHRSEQYLVQVPDRDYPIWFSDLVAATAVDPADILAGRLIPDPAGVTDGFVLTAESGVAVWEDPVGGRIQIVDELPADPDPAILYFIPEPA